METLTWRKVQEIERLANRIGVLPDQLVEALILSALGQSDELWKEQIEDNELLIVESINEATDSRTYE